MKNVTLTYLDGTSTTIRCGSIEHLTNLNAVVTYNEDGEIDGFYFNLKSAVIELVLEKN